MGSVYGVAVAVAIGVLATAAPARADGFIIPSAGLVFGGDSGTTLGGSIDSGSRMTWSVSIGGMGGGIFGMEEDISFTPNFFGQGGNFESTRVVTAMTNLIIGLPFGGQAGGGVRPYASGGVGLIHRHVESKPSFPNFASNDFGYNLGLGVMGYFADHVGARVDFRHFRNFKDTDTNAIGLSTGDFNFSRASVGIIFRF